MPWTKEDAELQLLSLIQQERRKTDVMSSAFEAAVDEINSDEELDAKTRAKHILMLKKQFEEAMAASKSSLSALDMLNKLRGHYSETTDEEPPVFFDGEDDLEE